MDHDEGKLLCFPKDLIECPVCFETFDQPKVLPCQHTFCLTCLDGLCSQDNRVTCPICQRIAELPSNGTSHLPTNYFLVHLLDVCKPISVDNKEVACEACVLASSCLKAVEAYCVDCAQSLCKACANVHSGIRTLRHHQLISIDANDPDRLTKLLMNRPVYCADHPTNELAFHCRDCSLSICVNCGFLRHRNHECVDIKEKADEFRQEIEQMFTKISLKISDSVAARQELNHSLVTFNDLVERIQKEISAKTKEVIGGIRRQEKGMLKTVKEFEKQFKTPIEFSTEDIESKVGNMELFVQFCRKLKDYGSHTDVIRLWPQLITKGTEYQGMSISRTVVHNISFSPSTNKIDEINFLGVIEISETDKRSEICTDSVTTTSDCHENLLSSVQYNDTHPLTTTLLEKIQENENTVMTNNNQGSLQTQDSLRSNNDESVDSTDFPGVHSNDDDDNSPQFDSAIDPDENHCIAEDDSNEFSSLNNNIHSPCKDRQEETVSDLMSLKRNRRGSMAVVDTIDGKDPVVGIAVLGFIYVLRQTSNHLESYDLQTLNLVASLEFDEVRIPTDLTACALNQTLYIGHTKKIVFSYKVNERNSMPRRLTVAFSYKHLSVTSDSSVLMGCPKADKILEYKEMPLWTELRRISIPGSYPTSMVQISSNFFVVSSKMNVLYFVHLNGSCVTYECVSVPHNISHIATDVGGSSLLVANCYGHSVLNLDLSPSGNTRSSPIVEPKTICQPSRLWTDKASRRLFVGTAQGDVKILHLL